ncbi:BMP and activin membrane-bound inhibitor homolog [Coccinella septempunctata]|uniref:BMP and activin membrane-bound inhibitor homolog n=1 Tax=Coccinella septempunctata TaxID=41139 RepID=UPI001D097EC8|nr:BMP and activin membrane-bound inhibitor homolog [Coccinella septempunctata]
MNLKLRTNEFVTVITLVINWRSSLAVSQNMEESVRVNRPIARTDNAQPWVKFSSDYVRCFCNLPSCVHTGYMCKSNGAGCFSDLWEVPGLPTGYRGRHGCLELINTREKQCTSNVEEIQVLPKQTTSSKQYIHCCYQDMCNHMDSPQTKFLINSTFHGTTVRRENMNNHRPNGYSNSEVWFRAATIAVPICGAVILFALIALAMRILRNERHNTLNYKLGPSMYIPHVPAREKYCYHHYDYLKKQIPRAHNPIYRPTTVEMIHHQRHVESPLLVQNEISIQNKCKNETNAKLNQLHCDPLNEYLSTEGKSIILDIEKVCTKEPQNDINKNINEEEKFSDIKYGDKNFKKSSPNV